jgi:hypothetical protein
MVAHCMVRTRAEQAPPLRKEKQRQMQMQILHFVQDDSAFFLRRRADGERLTLYFSSKCETFRDN